MHSAQEAADQLLAARPIAAHPYFASLLQGKLGRSRFVHSQRQFYYAVAFFSRAMAALMARLPDSTSRAVLMHNLAEEHGWDEEGTGRFQPGMAHDRTFLAFLASMGEVPAEQGPEVRAFNLALYGACVSEPTAVATACLGIIEYTFADISSLIGSAVVEQGWVAAPDLVHYTLHAAIDKRHAAEFFRCLEGADPAEVRAGLVLGWHIFGQLYRSLLAEP